MYRKICALVDGSAASMHALGEAVKVAKMSGASILALHVVDLLRMEREEVMVWEGEALNEKVREAARQILDDAKRAVAGSGVSFESKVLSNAGEKIEDIVLDEVEDSGCDLIAMGTHGYTGMMNLLLGSVAKGVLRKADVPVLLVRMPE
ncbi:universal stress protein [Neisseria canis]|uniref:Putative universal stress protein n=1 Tax=Neisseria canis TaxID=493 RepID=A0A1X3CYG7_9NEIS|nr:universal stress protein [Neisseria canis]OSI12713.1 hypothetical protein BWD07_04545 [Neisseria canis]VEF02582.1 putative universal stress protein [Neisseria canis]